MTAPRYSIPPPPPPGSLKHFVAEGKTRLETSSEERWEAAEAAQAKRVLNERKASTSGFRPGDWRSDPTYRALGKAYDKRNKMAQEFRRELIAIQKKRDERALKNIEMVSSYDVPEVTRDSGQGR